MQKDNSVAERNEGIETMVLTDEDDGNSGDFSTDSTNGVVPAAPAAEDIMEDYVVSQRRQADSDCMSMENVSWRAKHSFSREVTDALAEISDEFIGTFSETTDLEMDIGPYRPTRSRFGARLCLRLHVTTGSRISVHERRRLQAFFLRHAAALSGITGLCVYGHDACNFEADGGIAISVVSTFLDCAAGQTGMRLNLFQLQAPGNSSDEDDIALDATGGSRDWVNFAALLCHYSKDMSYFYFRANLLDTGMAVVLQRNELSGFLSAVIARWTTGSEVGADYFGIDSDNFFNRVPIHAITELCSMDLGCKMRINCRGNKTALSRFVSGACLNSSMGRIELVVEDVAPFLEDHEDYIAPPILRLLENNTVFRKITYRHQAAPNAADGAVTDYRVLPYWKAALRGRTTWVSLDMREGPIGETDPHLVLPVSEAAEKIAVRPYSLVPFTKRSADNHASVVYVSLPHCVEMLLPLVGAEKKSPLVGPQRWTPVSESHGGTLGVLHGLNAPPGVVFRYLREYPGSLFPTGVIQSRWECLDRNGNTYVKILQFKGSAQVEEHKTQLHIMFTLLQGLAKSDPKSFTEDHQRLTYNSLGAVVLGRLTDHIDQWGMARIPGNVRLAVHVLQAKMSCQLIDFGTDPDVILGAPYNGLGP